MKAWRIAGYPGGSITPVTRQLLQYWTNPERENKLFYCQIEALETAIYITEVAPKFGDAWIENELRAANELSNPGLSRMAFKMATGSGKTVVMAMLIAWQGLNKLANPQDARFSDAFLLISPGITIRDRLRVLLPNDPANYYRSRDVLPPDLLVRLQQVKIIITNFHAFLLRETVAAGKLTKDILGAGKSNAFTESPDVMVRRVCRELGNKRTTAGFWGDTTRTVKDASFERIGAYFLSRLKTIFAGVADKPQMLTNSRNNPIFSLCFAAGNKRGAPTAVKIAQDILKG